MKLPEQVEKTLYPKAIRTSLNINSNLAKRPWTITFSTQNKNVVHQTDEKVVIELTTIRAAWCDNGIPKYFDVVGQVSQSQPAP